MPIHAIRFAILLAVAGLLSGFRQEKPGIPRQEGPGQTKALERTIEDIADHLRTVAERKVMLLWVVDSSNSMVDDRDQIKAQLSKIFDKVKGVKDLHMAVLAFDEKPRPLVPFTTRMGLVQKGLDAVGVQGKGIENCMAAVQEGARLFPPGRAYRMIVLVTDERGDDASQVEATLAAVRKVEGHVFVLGRETPFGWDFAYELDEKTGVEATVLAGTESAGQETLQMSPLCCNQPWVPWCRKMRVHPDKKEYESFFRRMNPIECDLGFDQEVPSGFGPWAQSRLAADTGGRCFLLREKESYSAEAMKGYEPELCTADEWQKRKLGDELRGEVLRILAELGQGKEFDIVLNEVTKGVADKQVIQPCLRLERRVKEDWARSLEAARAKAGKAAGKPLKRWVAHADLLAAQLQVLLHGLEQVRLAAAEGPFPQRPVWFTSWPTVRGSGEARKAAIEKLDAAIKNHPGTPWARTAELLKEKLPGFMLEPVRYGGGGAIKPGGK